MAKGYLTSVLEINNVLTMNNRGDLLFSRKSPASLIVFHLLSNGELTLEIGGRGNFISIERGRLRLSGSSAEAAIFVARPAKTIDTALNFESLELPGLFLRSDRRTLVLSGHSDGFFDLETAFRVLDHNKQMQRYSVSGNKATLRFVPSSSCPEDHADGPATASASAPGAGLGRKRSFRENLDATFDSRDDHQAEYWRSKFQTLQQRTTALEMELDDAKTALSEYKGVFSAQREKLSAAMREVQVWRERYGTLR